MIWLFVSTWVLSTVAFVSFDFYANNESSIIGEAASDIRAASKSVVETVKAVAKFLLGLAILGSATYILVRLAAAII